VGCVVFVPKPDCQSASHVYCMSTAVVVERAPMQIVNLALSEKVQRFKGLAGLYVMLPCDDVVMTSWSCMQVISGGCGTAFSP
jgi:predicted MarR family transcription regulator